MYKTYLPLMPLALEQLDLRGYDLVISSESGRPRASFPLRGTACLLLPYADALHLEHVSRLPEQRRPGGAAYDAAADPLSADVGRDVSCTGRQLCCELGNGRKAHSPILRRGFGCHSSARRHRAFSIAAPSELGDYYLMAGELVSYKRPDLAVRAFNEMKLKLVVIGGGEMLDEIRRLAGPTVTVMGSQPFDVLKQHYARCRALIFPGEEDFGMVPVEAMASGRPVVAFGRGGATETVAAASVRCFLRRTNRRGHFVGGQKFGRIEIDPEKIAAHASQFGRDQFFQKMQAHIDRPAGREIHHPLTRKPEEILAILLSRDGSGIDHRQ